MRVLIGGGNLQGGSAWVYGCGDAERRPRFSIAGVTLLRQSWRVRRGWTFVKSSFVLVFQVVPPVRLDGSQHTVTSGHRWQRCFLGQRF